MENSIKDLYGDMDETTFGFFACHLVAYFPKIFIDPKAHRTEDPQPKDVSLQIYYVAKTIEDAAKYFEIIKAKINEEIGVNADALNTISFTMERPKTFYCVIANDADYDSQDILQDNFSIKNIFDDSTKVFELVRKSYYHHYSDLMKKFSKVGLHSSVSELNEHLLEDLVKANSLGYVKESVKEDTVGIDQYGFWMIPITIYETIPDGTGSALVEDYTIYFAAQNKEQTETYESIIKEKLLQEFNVEIIGGKRINQDKIKQWLADGQSRISVKTEWPTYCYSVVAASFDFSAQNMLQPDYSIKQNLKNIINPKGHVDYRFQKGLYSDLLLKAINVGIYKTEKEFQENYFEDMIKVNSLDNKKEENLHEDGIDVDKYEFCIAPVSVYETIRDKDGTMDVVTNTIYVAAKNIKSINKYKDILIKKINKESFHAHRTDVMIMCYSVAANSVDYDSQDVLQDDYSITDHIKKDSIDIALGKAPSFLGFGVYSDVLKNIVEVGIYMDPERLQENYFEDMVTMVKLGLEDNMDECCCAGGIGGGVTTASFAPAVTHTMYPKPSKKKKKKSKKEDTDTIDDVYGFYKCVTQVWINFPNNDCKTIFFMVYGKNLDQIDEYNLQINKNVKLIDSYSRVCGTQLSERCYSVAAKDFNFDNQKVLDPKLYTNIHTPAEFHTSNSIIQNDIDNTESKIVTNCTNDLADFTNDLFTKLTEDTKPDFTIDDIYGFYGTVMTIEFGSIDYLRDPAFGRTHWCLIGKTPKQLNDYIEKVKKYVSTVDGVGFVCSSDFYHSYSQVIKDFDFEGQKILDSSLFVNDPNQMKKNLKTLRDDQVLIKTIIFDSSNDLVDFTDNLFSQMTEDTDDVYWPVRNDETDAFEMMIKNERKAKKEKIIARKERAINKRDETLFNWLRKMAAEDNYSSIAIHEKALKYNAITDKMRADLDRIKRLPLDSSEFSPK